MKPKNLCADDSVGLIRSIVITLTVVFLLAGILAGALDARVIAQSGPTRTALIEAYTSEGCSSCVAAWRWLAAVDRDRELFSAYVPVDFHVEYWDYLGWKDKFADPRFTARQNAYADLWGRANIYTPGLVLNGQEWVDWKKDPLPSVIGEREVQAGTLMVSETKPGKYTVDFWPDGIFGGLTAHIVLLVSQYGSPVKAGENTGRRLEHYFMAVGYKEVPMAMLENNLFRAKTALKFPPEAAVAKQGIAVFITDGNHPGPIQAAGAYFTAADPS